MITLSSKDWLRIRQQLRENYAWKPSILIIREVMKRELGFTVRLHQEYREQTGYIDIIYLDFYNDAMETHFRLKSL